MTEKQIELLRKQMENLDARDFNLEAWKTSTKLLLERIFGQGSPMVREIEKIHYDLSSWSLRDSLGNASTLDGCKRNGKAILEACILEIETLGKPETTKKNHATIPGNLQNALESHLTIKQYRELEKIIRAENETEEKAKKVKAFLEKLETDIPLNILSEILGHSSVSDLI